MRRTFLAPLVMLQERAEASRRRFFSMTQRTAIRDSVALRAMAVTSLESENDRLRQLIGLGARCKWGFIPAEALQGRGVRDVTTMTLTAGSSAGVRQLSPVVSPEGVVGMVIERRSDDEPGDDLDASRFPGERDVGGRQRLRNRAGTFGERDDRLSDGAARNPFRSRAQAGNAHRQLRARRRLAARNSYRPGHRRKSVPAEGLGAAPICSSRLSRRPMSVR